MSVEFFRAQFAIVLVSVFCSLWVGLIQPSTAAERANTVPVWLIKQSSYNLGNVDMILAKDAMKWHNDKLGITFLMHAPDWKLNAYNEANKKYLVFTKDEALELFQHQRRREHGGFEAPINVGARPPVAGMPTIAYCYAHNYESVSQKFAMGLANAVDKHSKLTAEQKRYLDGALKHQRREYWLSKDIWISPHISSVFLEKVAPIKYGDYMPLRLIQIGSDGSKTTMFDTKEVRKASAPKDTFNMPSGYTKAQNKIALLVNDDEFGFDNDSGLSSSKLTRKNESARR